MRDYQLGLHWRFAAIAALVLAGTTAGPAVAQAKRFAADDLPGIVRLADPQLAPDGKAVAVVMSRANLKDNRWDAELTLIDVASKAQRALTQGRQGLVNPRWSPDGRSLAFIANDAGGVGQLWVLSLGGGDARLLTRGKTPVTQLAWRPDGAAIAFAAADEVPEKTGEARFEDAFEVGNNGFLERAAGQSVHIWALTLADGARRQITSGATSLPIALAPNGPASQIAWTPDGRSIVFAQIDRPATGDADSARLALVDVADGKVRLVSPDGGRQGEPKLSPDGRKLAFTAPRDGVAANQSRVKLAALSGTAIPTDAAPALDRALNPLDWMPDSSRLLLSGNDVNRAALWLAGKDGRTTRLALGTLNPTTAMVGKSGAIVFTATSPDRPAELYLLTRPDAPPVRLTDVQTVTNGVALGRQEVVNWQSDSFAANGILTYPPGYVPGRKLPLVLLIHGGPTAASLETFSDVPQTLASKGWLVFEPNYRGSNNLGHAFQEAIIRDAGAGPGRDVMAGIAALKARGLVDENRIAVTGWSYGGYMASWLIGNYPDAWQAAIAGAPVTDMLDQYTTGDSNRTRAAQLGPSPFIGDNLASYAAQSPISYAWRAKTPTLILANVGDWRVTIPQAYKLYRALKDNGVPVSFFAYPISGHNPIDPIRNRDRWRRWAAFLTPYLDGPATASKP